jgi:hypothetical protein
MKANLRLERDLFLPSKTMGKLYINDKFECYTLEDTVRNEKIPAKTAIPKGKYKVILNMSKRFKRKMPLLLNVSLFEGIRIHSGNTENDTEGCILVGQSRGFKGLSMSRAAFQQLMTKLEGYKEIEIEIVHI